MIPSGPFSKWNPSQVHLSGPGRHSGACEGVAGAGIAHGPLNAAGGGSGSHFESTAVHLSSPVRRLQCLSRDLSRSETVTEFVKGLDNEHQRNPRDITCHSGRRLVWWSSAIPSCDEETPAEKPVVAQEIRCDFGAGDSPCICCQSLLCQVLPDSRPRIDLPDRYAGRHNAVRTSLYLSWSRLLPVRSSTSAQF